MSEKILVTRPSMPDIDEYIEEIKSIWECKWLTNMGPKHEIFRGELESYLDSPHVELMTNGHMALELSMQALGLTGEVITTPFTFASTVHAIVRNGLTPVFCDINEEDYTIDVDKLESLITEKTSAIVPVHVYGNVCNIGEIERIAKKYTLKVIFDSAHTVGVTYNGKSTGAYGDASCFSFHATKVFNTIEGGCVCYRDEAFGRDLFRLKDFGIKDEETVDGIGANAKMNEFCAAMGLCNLRHVDEEIGKRKLVVEKYRSLLDGVAGVKLCKEQKGVVSNYAYFPIVFTDSFGVTRDDVFKALAENNISARKYFYPLCNEFDCYRDRFDVKETPVAKYISDRVLTLPLYADLTIENVERICRVILQCKEK